MPKLLQAGLDIIKKYEGLRLEPYQDSTGRWSIGYGHTSGVSAYNAPITEPQANDLLMQDATIALHSILNYMPDGCMNDNQFSALVSLVFNVGTGPLRGTLGGLLMNGDPEGAANQFALWCHAGGVTVEGLVARRAEEKALFLTPVVV